MFREEEEEEEVIRCVDEEAFGYKKIYNFFLLYLGSLLITKTTFFCKIFCLSYFNEKASVTNYLDSRDNLK